MIELTPKGRRAARPINQEERSMKIITDTKALEILEQGNITRTVKAGAILAQDITMPTGKNLVLVNDITGAFLLIEA